ncbi:hypothetical protein SUGI_0010830 [Cryptomeria japonica]|uniref:serine carboxypeptidase-like 51 n=1 Tax=Cryptomeria japonica TaxID=3369 RepID=UPI002408BAAD|nr:serine carboxypeptidase-like 51 [Cryptomeria japonica]GLJ05095.1 hypothetical protein SUGI_0010830 [Cryptomeria japonica]
MTYSHAKGHLLILVWCLATSYSAFAYNFISGTPDGSEAWGYIEVRPKAHMFWWLYHSPGGTRNSWPLILWLQGGPGSSAVGIGNFQEIGPLNTKLKPRASTWLQKADLLFLDSPVGSGFSYVENDTLVAHTDAAAADDLLTFLKEFEKINRTLQNRPIFIVAESYGGKHASMLGLALSKAIAAGQLMVKLGGVALGDSWISPVDYVISWGPVLKVVSRLEDIDKAHGVALEIQDQVAKGKYLQAKDSWSRLQYIISSNSNNVDFYNFLLDSRDDPVSSVVDALESGTPRHYLRYLNFKTNSKKDESNFDLQAFMNGVIREKLKIIPPSIKWGAQSGLVFEALGNDFMKSTVDEVDELLSRGEKVTIYNGQLDLICATMGTEAWVQRLKWKGLAEFNSKKRTPLYCNGSQTYGFIKSYSNLQFFWILGAGHFVPLDQPCLALKMVDMIINMVRQ